MSRVFDTPRYEKQTLHKILVTLCTLDGSIDRCSPKFFRNLPYGFDKTKSIFVIGLCGAQHHQYAYPSDDADIGDSELFNRYTYLEGLMRGDPLVLTQYRRGATLLEAIIHKVTEGNKPIYTDHDATYRLVGKYISGEYKATRSNRAQKRVSEVAGWARDVTVAGMIACRLGHNVVTKVMSEYKTPNEAGREWASMWNWAEGFEKLRLASYTPEIIEAHEYLRDGGRVVRPVHVDASGTYAGRNLGCNSLYRVLGLFVIEYADAVYILDHSAMDQIHQIARSWEGAWGYATNYRKCGMLDSPRDDYMSALKAAQAWISETLRETSFSVYLPRSMKQSVALLQNELHTHAEVLEMGAARKTQAMETAIAGILPMKTYWHDFLLSLKISDRTRLDLANCYYFLPAPDANPPDLFDRAITNMNDTKHADPYMFDRFLNYSKSVDLCKYLCRFRKIPNHSKTEGYELEGREWVTRCLKGDFCLPPENELGMVWIEDEFPFVDYVPDWYWEAADVTHVNSDIKPYTDLTTAATIPRVEHNELLYALKYAPKLSKTWDPEDVIAKLGTGEDRWDRIAVMASKSENTKPGKKVRETWSADDITREITSTYDRQAAGIASLHRGVVSRKPPAQVDRMFDRVAELTTKQDKGAILIVSDDVSGWSPSGDRTHWEKHHNYVVRTTKAPKNLTMSNDWKGMTAVVNKRGMHGWAPLPNGLFQGWTGQLDTVMNVHISQFCVHMGKQLGYLRGGEAATTAGLIDDALQGLELEVPASDPRAQAAADAHFETTAKVWRSLGAELDVVKTMYSSIKLIFLNRLYCEGSEIMHAMKVFARCDREVNRRYSDMFSQIDTILGSYRSASEKGGDPIACYLAGIFRCMDLVHQTCGGAIGTGNDPFAIINAAFAPRTLGGWGIPHIIGWLTKEDQDPLTRYVSTLCSINQFTEYKHPSISEYLQATLAQPLQKCSATLIMSDPRSPRAEGVVNPLNLVTRHMKVAMSRYAQSPIFRDAFNIEQSEVVEEAKLRALRAARWDASVLEVLSGCTPESVVQSLVDRAYKNDMLTAILKPRDKRTLAAALRKANFVAAMHLINIPLTRVEDSAFFCRANVMEIVGAVVDRAQVINGVTISNVIIPDYGTCLTHRADRLSYCTSATFSGLSSKCSDRFAEKGRQYRNFYEAAPTLGKMKGSVSKKPYNLNNEGTKSLTPPQKAFEKASILAAHVREAGGDGDAVFAMAMASWGLLNLAPQTTVTVMPGASLKRISTRVSHVEHSIAMFPNTIGAVQVEATPLGKYLDVHKTGVDYMSLVTATRTCALLEYACGSDRSQHITFGVLPGVLNEYDDVAVHLIDPDEFNLAVNVINRDAPDWVKKDAESILLRTTNVAPAAEGAAIVVNTTRGGKRRVHGAVFAPGAVAHMLTAGMAPPKPVVKTLRGIPHQGDEVTRSRSISLATRFRRLRELLPNDDAAAGIFCEQLAINIGQQPSQAMHNDPWNRVGGRLEAEVPNWRMALENAKGAVMNQLGHIPVGMSTRIAGSEHYKRILYHGVSINEAEAATFCAIAWLASYGRPRTPEAYYRAAIVGIHAIRRAWNNAASRYSSRGGTGPHGMAFTIMGGVYRQVCMASSGNPTTQSLLNALSSGLVTGTAMATGMAAEDVPLLSVASLYAEDDSRRMAFLDACFRWLSAYLPAVGARRVVDVLGYLINDFRLLHRAESAAPVHAVPTLVHDRAPGVLENLPQIDSTLSLSNAPALAEATDESELAEVFSENELLLFRIGATYGMGAAKAFAENGTWPGDVAGIDEDVTEEEIREWLADLHGGGGFVQGDEILG